MQKRKSKKFFIYFFLLIIISSTNNVSLNNLKFQKVQNIEVSGLSTTENKLILNQIKKLNLNNIFFISNIDFKNLMNSNPIIETYQVFKKYPSAIQIMIKKTKFLARINYDNKIFLIGSNGKLIDNTLQEKNLPFIFGNPEIQEFLKFKKILDQSQFPFKQIDSLYFFPSKRWDIKLKNNILLKLSQNSSVASLDYAYNFLKENDVGNFNIVDIRINNQIILNE